MWGWMSLDALGKDIRHSLRMMRRSPGFTVAVVFSLALGIGVNTTVFSVVNAFIFRPLPVGHSSQLAVVAGVVSSSGQMGPVSFLDLQDYRAATRGVFEDIAGYSAGLVGLTTEGERAHRVLVTWVTGNYFSTLGLRPTLGRLIRTGEGLPGRVDTVVDLGYSTWRKRFQGDPSVVGRRIVLNGRPFTIVGVVSEGFAGTFAFSESELFLPVNWSRGSLSSLEDRGTRALHTIGRLRQGVSFERAQTALNVVAARLDRDHPDTDRGIALKILPERLARPEEDNARTNGFVAAVMLALVGLVLVVSEANVVNLLLAGALSRRREVAIRAALGANRGRLIRQFLTESSLFAAFGGIAGIALGALTARLLAMIRLPGDLPVRLDFRLDTRVLAYAVFLTAVTTLLMSLLAARRVSRVNVDEALRDCPRGATSSAGAHSVRRTLVVAQIAVSFVLLVAAGLLTRSLAHAEHSAFGFRTEGILNVTMDVSQLGYTQSSGQAFFDEVRRQVGAI